MSWERGACERRLEPAALWACVSLPPAASWDAAFSRGFHALFEAIERAHEPMQAPVVLRNGPDGRTMCFKVSKEVSGPGVTTVRTPPTHAWVRSFGGWANEASSMAHLEELRACVPPGTRLRPDLWALYQYSSPMRLAARRNEVVLFEADGPQFL